MDKRILLLEKMINYNLKSPPTIEEISAQFNMSSSGFRQFIKEKTGMPLGEYVLLKRLERACELLETTYLRVQEIGAAVGFDDQYYFSRVFKKKYGLSPSEYRKKCYDVVALPDDAGDKIL